MTEPAALRSSLLPFSSCSPNSPKTVGGTRNLAAGKLADDGESVDYVRVADCLIEQDVGIDRYEHTRCAGGAL